MVQALVMQNLPPHLATKLNSGDAAVEPEPEPEVAAAPTRKTREHRNVFAGDKYDIFNPDAAAVFGKVRNQGKRAMTEGRDLLDSRTEEEKARQREGAKLADVRQHDEEQQRRILETIQKSERARQQQQQKQRQEQLNGKKGGGGGGGGDAVGDLDAVFAEIASEAAEAEAADSDYLFEDNVYDAERAYDEMRKRDDGSLAMGLARQSSEIQSIMYDDEYDDALDEFDNVDMDAGASGLEALAASLQQRGGGGKRLAELKAEIARDNALLNRTSEAEEVTPLAYSCHPYG